MKKTRQDKVVGKAHAIKEPIIFFLKNIPAVY